MGNHKRMLASLKIVETIFFTSLVQSRSKTIPLTTVYVRYSGKKRPLHVCSRCIQYFIIIWNLPELSAHTHQANPTRRVSKKNNNPTFNLSHLLKAFNSFPRRMLALQSLDLRPCSVVSMSDHNRGKSSANFWRSELTVIDRPWRFDRLLWLMRTKFSEWVWMHYATVTGFSYYYMKRKSSFVKKIFS